MRSRPVEKQHKVHSVAFSNICFVCTKKSTIYSSVGLVWVERLSASSEEKLHHSPYLAFVFPCKYMKTGFPSLNVFSYHARSFPWASFHWLSGTVCLKIPNKLATLRIINKQVMPCSPLSMLEKLKKKRLNLDYTHQTPRETPSSDVRYMLMVWLREKSAGRPRSSKNGSLTANGNTKQVGLPSRLYSSSKRQTERSLTSVSVNKELD